MVPNLQAGVEGQPPFICNPGLSVPEHTVERISLGSLLQSLKTIVATLTDPCVILRRLWHA